MDELILTYVTEPGDETCLIVFLVLIFWHSGRHSASYNMCLKLDAMVGPG